MGFVTYYNINNYNIIINKLFKYIFFFICYIILFNNKYKIVYTFYNFLYYI